MATRRKSIKLFDHDRRTLIELYARRRLPIEQYESRPEALQSFLEEWNRLSGRKDTAGDLMHYMRTQRKAGRWVRLGQDHESAPRTPELSAEETEVLVRIYSENVAALGLGSDVLAYDDEIADLIAKSFLEETGRFVPAYALVAKLTALRKRGLLPKVGEQTKEDDGGGFDDMDAAIG
jgi:hypothetical protein